MRPRFIISLMIFLASYLPLSAILLAQDFRFEVIGEPFCNPFSSATNCESPFSNGEFSITIFLVCLICLVISLTAIQSVRAKRSISIVSAKHSPAELINYSIPYVVSFMSIGYDDTGKFIGLIIFLAWMFWLSHMSGQIILNPVLIAFGWRFYEVTYRHAGSETTHTGFALAKDEIRANEQWKHAQIRDILVLKDTIDGRENVSS